MVTAFTLTSHTIDTPKQIGYMENSTKSAFVVKHLIDLKCLTAIYRQRTLLSSSIRIRKVFCRCFGGLFAVEAFFTQQACIHATSIFMQSCMGHAKEWGMGHWNVTGQLPITYYTHSERDMKTRQKQNMHRSHEDALCRCTWVPSSGIWIFLLYSLQCYCMIQYTYEQSFLLLLPSPCHPAYQDNLQWTVIYCMKMRFGSWKFCSSYIAPSPSLCNEVTDIRCSDVWYGA